MGPRPKSPRRRVTHRGGRPRPSCLQSRGRDGVSGERSRRGEELAAKWGGGGEREAPARGARDLGRSRQGLDALPGGGEAAEEAAGDGRGGGEGAGRRLRPGEEGGGRQQGGCPTANTHWGAGLGAAGCREASRQGRTLGDRGARVGCPPICLLSCPAREASWDQRASRMDSHQMPGLGTWHKWGSRCSKRACSQTPGRTSWIGKRDRETPLSIPPGGSARKSPQPPV